jgi:DUF4097 and DUF4098 domain-containing protein YvlB
VVRLTRQTATAVAALALTIGLSPSALAQDVRVQVGDVKVVVPTEVLRQVQRIVTTTITPQVRTEIAAAVREAVAEISSIGRDIGREVGREVSVEIQRGRDRDDQDRRVEQVDKQTTKIPLGPTGTLDLKNISGDITVTAGNGREVVMDITRRSRGRTDADAKLGLEQVKVEVDHRGDRATVETRYPDQQGRQRTPYSVSVTYNVTAPVGTRVSITNISGSVTATGLHGDLSVDVVSGDIEISNSTHLVNVKSLSGDTTITDVESDGNLSVGAVSGDLTFLRVKVRRLSVNVISGDVVATDVSADGVELTSMSGSVQYSGPIARNGRYQLQAHSGDIRIAIGGNVGFDLRAETFSGQIRADSGIELKSPTSSRRSLRGTVGDGSAVVVATTFSGNVIISRR